MPAPFSERDDARCLHYAVFTHHLSRSQADAIFWVLFVLVIVFLVIGSQMYTKASKTLTKVPDPEKGLSAEAHANHVRLRCLLISLGCCVLALACIIMEAFALFSIEYCHGEDLVQLYWSFWTLIQVGALIAILGIAINQAYALHEKEQPPWNVALGTPVLVLAGVGHSWDMAFRSVWRKYVSKKPSKRRKSTSTVEGTGLSRSSTMNASASTLNTKARHVGYTLADEPLYVVPVTGNSSASINGDQPVLFALSTLGGMSSETTANVSPEMSSAALAGMSSTRGGNRVQFDVRPTPSRRGSF